MSASTTQPVPPEPARSPEDLIAEPAVDGDLTAELKQVARPFGRSTLVLAGLLLLALAFAGGAWTHAAFGRAHVSTSDSATVGVARPGR
ncbi:hypothetical protein [Amycolatopsis sp. WGS_07]|uniref:hypothetical protein n=1 Tax=Amycolatopsis sp. WGS_07 TaxID=3076764 RepID=UPI003872B20C